MAPKGPPGFGALFMILNVPLGVEVAIFLMV
jgi:hypothetical protein